jgi:hypothetical protein
LVRLLGTLKEGKPRLEPTRKETPPPPETTKSSGLPAQHPPRQSRANVIQHESTALNSYVADDTSYDELDVDQWVLPGYDTNDDLTDDESAFGYSDRFINSVRTGRLPTIPILYTHRNSDFVSVIDGGSDTMVLGTGWRFIDVYPHLTVNIVAFDESDARNYGCKIGTAVSIMKDISGVEYLMVAHEEVQNHRSSMSLLSEGQMRHYGLIVDSISNKHRGIDGLPGTQSIYAADKSIQFQMT